MAKRPRRTRTARRRNRRYIVTLVLFAALIGGWSWFWHYAAGKAEVAIDGWRAREAKAGRVYKCGAQTIGGYPFRIEVNCDNASALFRSNQPPVEIKASGMLIAAQIYQPNLLITEFHGPLTIADPGSRRPSSPTGSWHSRACAARRPRRNVCRWCSTGRRSSASTAPRRKTC